MIRGIRDIVCVYRSIGHAQHYDSSMARIALKESCFLGHTQAIVYISINTRLYDGLVVSCFVDFGDSEWVCKCDA
jgi:hypothetical protein